MKLDTMQGLKRTHWCGTLRAADAGRRIAVAGWVQRQRDMGQLIFIDLRDRTGLLQLTFDDHTDRAVFEKAAAMRAEYVLMAEGELRVRSAPNAELPTGEVELFVHELRLLGQAQTPPFEILPQTDVREELRLAYRYLDLRRPPLQQNLLARHKIVKVIRDYYDEQGFVEIETPMLIKSTPEGARDYLVPSRVHAGSFYALPQSPQMYKQLLMLAGFDRYMQIARCFRDEDLRADRQPEFTQIDLEMSFVDADDVMAVNEGMIQRLFREILGVEIALPLPRMTYTEAMERYGSDKPDVRFGMELTDLTDLAAECGFGVFEQAARAGGAVRGICVPQAADRLTRREIDRLTEFVRGIGAKGLAFIRWNEEAPAGSFVKFLTPGALEAICARMGAQRGDVLFFVADQKTAVLQTLGALRLEVARGLGRIPEGFSFLWITQFPFFDFDAESGQYVAMHHPFTAPLPECVDFLDSAPARVFAQAYDLVLNGVELASGSIRITDPALQKRMFAVLGLSEAQAKQKFGFLTDAFQYGAPPHGGIGIGLDRLIMLMLGCQSIRDCIAFPKLSNASEPMSGAPGPVDQSQLAELHIQLQDAQKENG